MLLVFGVVVTLLAVLLLAEVLLARTGEQVDTPDVATLSTTIGPGARPVTVLWMGDSTTAAVGTSGPKGSVSTQTAERVVARNAAVTITNRVIAHSGDRVGDVVGEQLPMVNAIRPDVVVISVGANDTIHLTSAGTFRHRYRELLDGLRRAGVAPERTVLIGVPDMGSPTRLRQPLRAITGLRGLRLDREVKAMAKERGARYVDLFEATSTPFRQNPSRYLAADEYHPSDAGYGLWADAIAPVLDAAVRDAAHDD